MSVLIFAFMRVVISDHLLKRLLPLAINRRTLPLCVQLRRQHLHASNWYMPRSIFSIDWIFSSKYHKKVRTAKVVYIVCKFFMIVPRAVKFYPGFSYKIPFLIYIIVC